MPSSALTNLTQCQSVARVPTLSVFATRQGLKTKYLAPLFVTFQWVIRHFLGDFNIRDFNTVHWLLPHLGAVLVVKCGLIKLLALGSLYLLLSIQWSTSLPIIL